MMFPVRQARIALAGVLILAFVAPTLGRQDKPKTAPATLIVKMPRADAKLYIEDDLTKLGGEERRFTSPPLQIGKKYVYTLKAFWEPNNYTKITRVRAVVVKAGETVDVDMNKRDKDADGKDKLDDIVIRYVPTPQEVVDAMCKLGNVKKDDVVFDLGCGDGRIVITAVEKFGAKKGVGVDIDPERIKDSMANLKNSKVGDKVEFRQDDVFKVKDIGTASVVMLYMGNDLNLQLRPILLKELKPGSRIVSHRFIMGDWKPEKTETITLHGEEYLIHLWTVPKKDDKK